MKVLEAKDFLVRQTAEQAALENVPLSDLEKRMMYFTETDECPEDPIALNDAFDAEYDAEEYEVKIAKLMGHAHSRIKKENPDAARQWKEAIKELSKGDHYILILCGEGFGQVQIPATERPPYDSLKLLGTAILVIVAGMALILGFTSVSDHYHWHWRSGPKTQSSLPVWIQRTLLFLIVGGYVYFLMLSWLRKLHPSASPGELGSKILFFLLKKRR
jgi:hypothetical protein